MYKRVVFVWLQLDFQNSVKYRIGREVGLRQAYLHTYILEEEKEGKKKRRGSRKTL